MRVLVIGSGLAGLATAIGAHDAGHDVVVATKSRAEEGSTALAQGGIAAAVFPGDSVQRHIDDTLAAGAGLSDAHAVRVLCEEGPAAVRELIRHGVSFDRDESGIARGLEAAHSRSRVLHANGDATGLAVETALLAAVRARGIELIEDAVLVDLIVEGGRVSGARMLVAGGRVTGARMLVAGAPRTMTADATVLATGGWGRLYGRTTSPAVSTGDGVAAAMRAGAAVADLEFTQFHPTALAVPDAPLVSEAVRGEGAVLRDESGRRFLLDLDPRGELAPRDVVARGVHAAMAAQGGRPVLLDATALGAEFLARRFPGIDASVRAAGYDWGAEPVPVSPAAHYAMGGIDVDDLARTSLPGLFAVGEVARTGVHGANRLASNSLLEAAVFADRAVRGLAETRPEPTRMPAPAAPLAGPGAPGTADGPRPDGAPATGIPFSRDALQELMWNRVGLVRDAAGLTAAEAQLAAWAAAAADDPEPADRRAVEDRNLLELGLATARAALARPRSVGAHYRRDDPAAAAIAAAAPGATRTEPRTEPQPAPHREQEAA